MAISHKSGKYLKVCCDGAEFRPGSVTVQYYEFKSEAASRSYFATKDGIFQFLAKGDLKFAELDLLAVRAFKESGVCPSTVKVLSDVPTSVQDLIVAGEELFEDLTLIRFTWDDPNRGEFKFKQWGLLKDMGFDKAWLVPIAPWALRTVTTGRFSNQDFSHACLYAELKKVFKDDYIDC